MKAKKKSALQLKITNKKRKISLSDWQLYSLCAIPVIMIFIFNYIPMFGVVIAFKNYKFNLGILESPWVGLKNFEFFFKSDVFFQLVRNTVLNNALFIVTGMFFAILVAILLFELKSRRSTKMFQTLMITPHFMSWVVAAYMVYAILNPTYGYLNQLLGDFGIEHIDWYSKPNAWPVILTIVSIWKHVGMDCVYYYASLMSIDTSLFEAAEIDGANRFQRIIHIVLPTLIPLITILGIMKIGNIFAADFGLFYTVTQDGANGNLYETTNVISTYVFRTFKDGSLGNSYGLTTAVGLLQSVVGIILVCTTNWAAKRVDKELGLF
ncbi:MAG: sugar ABC transporter permease [Clostridia bacterium]|nr:sugar ABC transporter permease [Clostridia bacterium]